MIRTYTELNRLSTFNERFEYLKLDGFVGDDTFGFDRIVNQRFYRSSKWKKIRDEIIIRDNGCDLGLIGCLIYGKVIIHHMNPITKNDIFDLSDHLLNPEYLICVSHQTHNALHYGNDSILTNEPIQRIKNDTTPWKF